MRADSKEPRPLVTRYAIDTVRTYGVLSVLIFHIVMIADAMSGSPWRLPQIGLDVFFVVSGFLVWDITSGQEIRPSAFMAHRISRIAPLYTLLTLSYALCLPFLPVHFGLGAPVTPAHIALSLLYIPHTSGGGSMPVLEPGWTLVYDMYFFLLFALCLVMPSRHRLRAVSVVFLIPVCLRFVFMPKDFLLSTYTSERSLSFLAGIWIAVLDRRRLHLPLWLARPSALIFIASYLGLVLGGVSYSRGGAALWILVATAAVYCGVSLEAHRSNWLRIPFCNTVGRWSYSIYLSQAFSVPITMMIAPGPLVVRGTAAFATSLLVGWCVHDRLERPLNRVVRRYEARLQDRRGGAQRLVSADRLYKPAAL